MVTVDRETTSKKPTPGSFTGSALYPKTGAPNPATEQHFQGNPTLHKPSLHERLRCLSPPHLFPRERQSTATMMPRFEFGLMCMGILFIVSQQTLCAVKSAVPRRTHPESTDYPYNESFTHAGIRGGTKGKETDSDLLRMSDGSRSSDGSVDVSDEQTEDAESLTPRNLLKYVRLEDYVGEGDGTVTFGADLTLLNEAFPHLFDNSKPYVIKFTGDITREGRYDPDFAEHAQMTYEISKRLSPHPSIPRVIFFEKFVLNPFTKKRMVLPDQTPPETRERLWRCRRMSIAIVERVMRTHKHVDKEGHLTLPGDQIPCFWRRLFLIMDYVHSHDISLHDTKLWRMLLQNGEIMMFQWNSANIFVDDVAGMPHGFEKLTPNNQPHFHDVNRFGKRIKEQIGHMKKFGRIPTEDIELLTDLYTTMQGEKPPTLAWLVDHHEYFLRHADDVCQLVW